MSERPKVQISKVCVVHSHPGFESQRYRHHGEGPSSSQELRGGPFAFPVSVPRFEAARVDGRRLLDVVRRPYCTRVGGLWSGAHFRLVEFKVRAVRPGRVPGFGVKRFWMGLFYGRETRRLAIHSVACSVVIEWFTSPRTKFSAVSSDS